jgi:hypothetical protein
LQIHHLLISYVFSSFHTLKASNPISLRYKYEEF